MNLLASYAWLKEYISTDLSPETFAKELSLRSMSVETITRVADQFSGMVVGVVKDIRKHPDADRLQIVSTDCGSCIVEIVCGATNCVVGMKVVVAPVGTRVRWHGAPEWTVLEKASIRGVESEGMICAPSEIGLDAITVGEREIWDITSVSNAPAGTSLAEALDCDDAVFDCEITTNRPDAMGMIGLAREAACAISASFNHVPAEFPTCVAPHAPLVVRVEDGRCERYMAAVISGVTVTSSPWWMQKRLILAGIKPINTIVDITNYVMLEYGQPLHAFDASQIRGKNIVVRKGKKGEILELLDGKSVNLDASHIVIADQERALALAGIMGGKDSGISISTTTVVFEAATFDSLTIRKSARSLDLATDAQLLFEKGLSPNALPHALARAVALAKTIADGTCEQVIDCYPKPRKPKTFVLRPSAVRARIGVDIDDATQIAILQRLGFGVESHRSQYRVTVPYWREDDIEGEVDFTEEIARMYGYHMMPSVLPASRLPEGIDDASLTWEMWLKKALAERGYTECCSNSLVSASDLETYGVSPKDAMSVLNPLTNDLTHLRPKLVPSMLRTIERNQAHTPSAKVFEIARVYIPRENDLPEERLCMVFGSYGVDDAEKAFMELRGVVDWLSFRTGISLTFERRTESDHWHTGRTVTVHCDGVRLGFLGQISAEYQLAFGIHRPVSLCILDLESVLPQMCLSYGYAPVSTFPSVRRDIAVLLDERVEYQKFHDIVRGSGSLVKQCDVLEIYRGEGIPEGKKSVTTAITLAAPDRTLTTEEVDDVMATVTREITLRLNGVLRS